MVNSFSLQIFFLILLGFIFALLSTPFATSFAKKINAIDMPDSASHKRHAIPMPLAGGFIIFAGSWLLALLLGLWKGEFLFLQVFLSGILIFVFGLLDDIYGLSAPQKFFGQFIASVILIYSGISVRFLETVNLSLPPFWLNILNQGLSLFWLVGITNAFNLIDSMDGLVAGLTFIIASFFAFISFFSGQTTLALFSSILIGLSLGLYIYNKEPARFFLGDSGSQLFGFFLAAIAILYRPPDLNPKSTWFIPVLLLGVPIFDTTLVMISRLRRGKPIFQADRSHTYHRLVDIGLSSGLSVIVIQVIALLLSFVAFVIMFLPPNLAIFFFVFILFVGFLAILCFERVFYD